ncbi:MAG: hypothetical protein L3J93_01505 [Thermoplasmata archaeon]|nr:hypothetical protein [Thermoplasmata archaeon]
MAAAVLVRGGGRLYLVDVEEGSARALLPLEDTPEPDPAGPSSADALRRTLSRYPSPPELLVGEPSLGAWLEGIGLPSKPAPLPELRRARERLPDRPFALERSTFLQDAHRRLTEALASPEQTLIALAREEERLERVETREEGAADEWIGGATGDLAEYAEAWGTFRASVREHRARLLGRLERAAESVAPNLSAIVGPRVAARLISAAGGLGALARMSSSRLQLLGTRRRPGGRRGPKYGVLARSVVAAGPPPGREGAFARSLAAWAAIAARADATTRRSIAEMLLARRDARLKRLHAGPRT